MDFWNSIDQLGKLNAILQTALVIFGIATGVIGAASFVVSSRKDTLTAAEDAKLKKNVGSIEQRTSDIQALPARHLSKKQQEILKASLHPSTTVTVLVFRRNSKESQDYSAEFEEVFKSVGWKIEHFLPATSFREVSSPFVGQNNAIAELPEFESLKEALQKAGLPFEYGRFNMDPQYHMSLDVGIVPANDYQALIDKIN